MKAAIVTIGDEILIGQIVDTNSSYIAKALDKIGIETHEMVSISDDKTHILQETFNKKIFYEITKNKVSNNKQRLTWICSCFKADKYIKEYLNYVSVEIINQKNNFDRFSKEYDKMIQLQEKVKYLVTPSTKQLQQTSRTQNKSNNSSPVKKKKRLVISESDDKKQPIIRRQVNSCCQFDQACKP